MLVGSTQPISLWEADGSSRAVLSDPGPHLADGRYITDPDAVALSDVGIAYFLGTSEDVYRTPGRGLWSIDTTRESYSTAIIEPHAAVPDIGPNVRLDYCCSSRSISENGHVFVHGRLARGGTINLSNETVLLLRRPTGELETIAQTGQRAPELSDNSRFAHLNGGDVNDAGDVIFSASVRTSVVAPGDDVLYAQPHDRDSPLLIAKQGDPIFDESTWELAGDLGGYDLNARGQVAFQSVPEGVDREHGSLWVWNPDGTYHSILNPGDTIEVAPGDIRRAAGVMLWTFNDRGELAFGVRFEDGSTALVVSDQVAIPEPTGAALVIVALGLCGLAGRHVLRNGRSTICER
jgi:hypothetical protein